MLLKSPQHPKAWKKNCRSKGMSGYSCTVATFFLINMHCVFVSMLFPVFFYLQYRMKLYKTSPTLPWLYSAVTWMGMLQNWLCCYFPRSMHHARYSNFNCSPYPSLHHVNELQSILQITKLSYKRRISIAHTVACLCTVKSVTAYDISSLAYCDEYINRPRVLAHG